MDSANYYSFVATKNKIILVPMTLFFENEILKVNSGNLNLAENLSIMELLELAFLSRHSHKNGMILYDVLFKRIDFII